MLNIRKIYIRVISIFVVLSFFATNFAYSDSFQIKRQNLAPESPINPIINDDKDINFLVSFLFSYISREWSEANDQGSIFVTHIDDMDIEINMLQRKCRVNDRIFSVSDTEGSRIVPHKKLKKNIIHASDERVREILDFCDSIGAAKIHERLVSLVSGAQLIAIEGMDTILPESGIAIDIGKDPKRVSKAILSKLLFDEGLNYVAVNDFKKAFEEFLRLKEKGKDFDLAVFNQNLLPFIVDMQNPPGISNEGNIILKDSAYNKIYDISGINIKDCDETKKEIFGIFSQIALEKLEEYNGYVSESERIQLEDMPGIFDEEDGIQNIVVEDFSDIIIPTAIIAREEDRWIIKVNEKFVRLMELLRRKGLAEIELRSSFRDEETTDVTNLHRSIIYSIAIHEIRGHFRLSKGEVTLEPDEDFAQGIRGNKWEYKNVLSLLAYLLIIVERTHNPRGRTLEFLDQHPEIIVNLVDEKNDLSIDMLKGSLSNDMLILYKKIMKGKVNLEHLRVAVTGRTSSYYRHVLASNKSQSQSDKTSSVKDIMQKNPLWLWLSEKAFTEMPDTSKIGSETKEYSHIVKMIKKAIVRVQKGDMEEYNKHASPGEEIEPENMSFSIERISECLLPLCMVNDEGHLTFNLYFVNTLALLWKKSKLIPSFFNDFVNNNGEVLKGGKYKGENLPDVSWIESLIYAIVIHEVRGHFPIGGDGVPMFTPDEESAQSERGNRFKKYNLVSFIAFYLFILEQYPHKEGTDILNPEVTYENFDSIERRARDFIENNKDIVRGMSEEEKIAVVELVVDLIGRMQDNLEKYEGENGIEYLATGTSRFKMNADFKRDYGDKLDSLAWNEGSFSSGEDRNVPSAEDEALNDKKKD
jgi:hypothetical protein